MYEAFLLARLDRSRACGAHARDRLVRRRTEFDQKPRRNHTGASEPAAAVDQHVSPAAQKRPQFCTRLNPFLLKHLIWRRYVDNRQMKPKHAPAKHFFAETFDPQEGHLLWLQECDDCSRSPITDGVEIERKIAIPISGHGVTVIFAGAKSNANAAEIWPGRHGGNLQRMREDVFTKLLQFARNPSGSSLRGIACADAIPKGLAGTLDPCPSCLRPLVRGAQRSIANRIRNSPLLPQLGQQNVFSLDSQPHICKIHGRYLYWRWAEQHRRDPRKIGGRRWGSWSGRSTFSIANLQHW